MLVPLKWLRDYVDIDIDTQEFADMMTMTGSKVEKVDFFGKETNGVEVCKILEIEQHPDADRLKVTKVEVANGEILQIVTNATNIKVGDYVPVARIGAVLPGDFKIKTIFKKLQELNAKQSSFCKHSTFLFNAVTKILL